MIRTDPDDGALLNAWPPFVTELALTVGVAWTLFVKAGPIADAYVTSTHQPAD